MPYLMKPYDDALFQIRQQGIEKRDRTGVGCISVAGIQCKYPLDKGAFPLVTKRQLYPKSVFAELLWFLSGSTMNQDLEALGCKFWGKWCDENNPKYVDFRKKWNYLPGDFGPIYGWQLRHFGVDYLDYRRWSGYLDFHKGNTNQIFDHDWHIKRGEKYLSKTLEQGFDQLAYMIDTLKNDPFGSNGRRCMFSLWNPKDLDKMALPPCHFTYQAIADGEGGLTGILTQRSCDWFIGVPANIQFYSALTIMLADQTGFKAREFIHNTNDCHIYLNQMDQVDEYLARKEEPPSPQLAIEKAKDIYSYEVANFNIMDYKPLAPIKAPVAV